MGKYIPGNPTFIVQNMTGAGRSHRGQLCLYRGEAGRADPRHIWPVDVFRPTGEASRRCSSTGRNSPGSATRSKRNLSSLMRTDTPYQSIEDVRKAAQPPKCGATGTEHFRLLHAKIFGRRARDQVQHRDRLSRRRRDRPRHRARRAALPQLDDQHLLRPRAVSDLAQERVCPADPANRKKKRSSSPRRAVHL